MCPGITSPGGKLPEVGKHKTVMIMAEKMENPLAIGYTVMDPKEM